MNGQAKALIPASIGIITLLLTGITGIRIVPGEQQAIQIAETRAITVEARAHQELASAFRDSADSAATQMGEDVAADLAVRLERPLPALVAQTGHNLYLADND